MEPQRRTVLLADPQPLFRAGLKTVLSEHGLEVIAEAADAAGAVAAAERHHPGVCIMDANLPGGGILAVRRLTYRVPDTRVIVIAPVVAADGLLAAVRAGASGFVPKTTTGKGLARAVESVLDGQAAIPRAAIAGLIHEFRGGGRQRASVGGMPLSLTEREAQVLELLRDSLTTQQIARELGLSPVTVRRHLGAIAAKAGKRGRTDLLRLVRVA
jgi:DNA-binding NarL/FixJ family response regulator